MVEAAHRENNVSESGGGSHKRRRANETRSGSSSGFGGGLLTYKRRKNVRVEKSIKKSSDQGSHERSCALTFTTRYCLLKHQRDIVLEQMCRSLETGGALRKYIQDALAFHSGSGIKTTVNESIRSCEAGTIFDIIMSEKFVRLCSLLVENGMKAEKLLNLCHINSRMNEKTYESSPMLFHSDIQQIWTKLQKLGNDITSLAKCLSDKTTNCFREQKAGQTENRTVCERLDNACDCGGYLCLRKFYHVKCLTSEQLISNGHCWYCPSCSCVKHDDGIQRVRKAKSWYENMQKNYKKRTLDGKLKSEGAATATALNKSGGVDMLLNAAKTLN